MFPGHQRPSCNSQLLLQWAPFVRRLHLNDWALNCQGIRQFVAAAADLTRIDIVVARAENAALADSILTASKSVLTICSDGSKANAYLPQELPQRLEVLDIAILPRKPRRAQLRPRSEAFLGLLASMPRLRTLSISCAPLALRCSVCLPRLARLTLHLRVRHGSRLDLHWLRSQQYEQLHIHLELDTGDAPTSQQVMSQLAHAQISHLHLTVPNFPVAAQQIWWTFSRCDSFHLWLGGEQLLDTIYALPLCKWVQITDARTRLLESLTAVPMAPKVLVISWQALARPGRVLVCQQMQDIGVQVQGFASPFPNSIQAPWQLIMHAVAGVDGLPPSRPTLAPATYYMQNVAADAASWNGTFTPLVTQPDALIVAP